MKTQLIRKISSAFFLAFALQSAYAFNWNTDTLKINIQPEPGTLGNGGFIGADVPNPPDGYLLDNGTLYADKGNGFTYGWDQDLTATMRYRIGAADVTETDYRRLTFCHLQKGDPATWEIALASGKYNVFLCGGDAINAVDFTNSYDIEGTVVEDQTPLTRGYDELEATVDVTDGNLTIKPADGLGVNCKLSYILISKYAVANDLNKANVNTLKVWSDASAKTVTIGLSEDSGKSTIEIFNINGELVYKNEYSSTEVNISMAGSKSGLYLVKCTQGQKVCNQKFVL